jgi:hypothetical protein
MSRDLQINETVLPPSLELQLRRAEQWLGVGAIAFPPIPGENGA